MTQFHPTCSKCGVRMEFNSYMELHAEEPHTVERYSKRLAARIKRAEALRKKRAQDALKAAQRTGQGTLFGGGS